MGRNRFLGTCGAAILLGCSVFLRAQSAPPQTQPPAVDFARDIQPIFEKYCYECHGQSKGRARLRLHAPELIRRGGQSGPVILPGKSHDSELIRRVLDENDDDRMPLDKDPLPAPTIAVLRAWIDQGLTCGQPIMSGGGFRRRALAYVARRGRPPGRANERPHNPIDRFVLARREQESCPRTEAARRSAAGHARLMYADASGFLDAFLATGLQRPTTRAVTGSWRRRTTASAGRGRGSILRATRTPTATRKTIGARSGNTATGSSMR